VSQKSSHLLTVWNFVKSWPILKFFALLESVWNLLQNPYSTTTSPEACCYTTWEIKNSFSADVEENANRLHFVISYFHCLLFIHKFWYFWCWKWRVFLHTDCKWNFPCHCSFTYLLLRSVCARTEENVETVNDLVLSQEEKPQTHRTVYEISWETGIHHLSLSQII